MLVPPTEPQELQPQELQPQPVLVPPTEPLQQGLQQEFATKSGNQIPPEELRALQELQELQELQAIKKSSQKRYRGDVCLHDILCQRSIFVYSQLSGAVESPKLTRSIVRACSGLGRRSLPSVMAPFTGGTGQSRSSWAAESSCFFFI